ncbi:PepSY domain-containing protein [Saliterribacillus persicus]|uniref:Putative small secreted protein n=1 Tax=Saliterribacillus persicus TaxID=930114 RepID=A0A368X3S2_9BACI|nr:PepSY domain-containing protein [Saliterribacillus persicus]RCW62671.1 putative small secreted protein [Saliterribacillus persicus]
MKYNKVILAAGLGVIAGFLISEYADKDTLVKPEKALKNARELFKKQGPVSGSWIYMKAEKINRHGLEYLVYRGGITKHSTDSQESIEFYLDAKSGTILEVKKTA